MKYSSKILTSIAALLFSFITSTPRLFASYKITKENVSELYTLFPELTAVHVTEMTQQVLLLADVINIKLSIPEITPEQIIDLGKNRLSLYCINKFKKVNPTLSLEQIFEMGKLRIDFCDAAAYKELDEKATVSQFIKLQKEFIYIRELLEFKKQAPETGVDEFIEMKKNHVNMFDALFFKKSFPQTTVTQLIDTERYKVTAIDLLQWQHDYPQITLADLIVLKKEKREIPNPVFFKPFLDQREGHTDSFIQSVESYENTLSALRKLQKRFLHVQWKRFHRSEAQQYEQENRLNEAIWSYQNAGTTSDLENAQRIDALLSDILMNGAISYENTQLDGSTGAVKVKLEHTIDGKNYTIFAVMKEDIGYEYSNIRSEYFASLLNDVLGIHVIPKTVLRIVNGTEYSLQYFWLQEKLKTSDLKEPYINDLSLFDYLTQNADRHAGNRFVAVGKGVCGRRADIIGIDNSGLWGMGYNGYLLAQYLCPKLIPSPRFFIGLVYMDFLKFKEIILQKGLATEKNLNDFNLKRKNVIQYIQQILENKTPEEIWPDYTLHFVGAPIL